ncbi:hypothetical protein diail_1928 [Diaporthe ilicicola]|nr:hypothetical protein diail_1928 [Diaporthe ilicicola]
MRFAKLLSAVLSATGVLAAAVVFPQNQAPLKIQVPGEAERVLEKKAFSNGPSYLTNKSQEFVVNGTGVPEVAFDIGESYAGRLPVVSFNKLNWTNISSDNQLFFWFFPSDNPLASNEITVWLNGGPGCSSMDGLLQENGPFLWQPGTYSPQPNPFSWTNLTNIVWIDQPIGTGLSSAYPGDPYLVTSEEDVASQFAGFWKNFIDTFDMHGYDVYLTGESYAGMFVPYIASHFLDKNDTTYYNVKGIQINDPAIGPLSVMEQAPAVQYLNQHSSYFNLNRSFTTNINEQADTCGYTTFMDNALVFPPKGKFAVPPSLNMTSVISDDCNVWQKIAMAAMYVNPCFNPYHITDFCPFPSNQLGFPSLGWGPNNYFNRTDVQKALNIHGPHSDFKLCRPEALGLESSEPSAFSALPSVIERTNNVVVGNGNLDYIISTNGTLAVLNNMTWNGAQGFNSSPFAMRFFVPYNPTILPAMEETLTQKFVPTRSVGYVGGGGWYGTTHTERGLTFVTVEFAGHQIPQYVPGAAYRQLEFLLGRVKDLSSVGEFTTLAGDSPLPPPTAVLSALPNFAACNPDNCDNHQGPGEDGDALVECHKCGTIEPRRVLHRLPCGHRICNADLSLTAINAVARAHSTDTQVQQPIRDAAEELSWLRHDLAPASVPQVRAAQEACIRRLAATILELLGLTCCGQDMRVLDRWMFCLDGWVARALWAATQDLLHGRGSDSQVCCGWQDCQEAIPLVLPSLPDTLGGPGYGLWAHITVLGDNPEVGIMDGKAPLHDCLAADIALFCGQ